ncbi:unnamed protein product [Moneuplotes crassus]|uniref:non-specific serine/threonine protein kinase n=2 Tax=Euplotes crassus TaxID=5936 RepID=A0AAD2D9W4_EUPCR|nr:unnamed protein product [Moneuplotes crassus]
MHRDLKSANVFLYKDGTAKLGDLNVSKVVKQGLGYTQTGTPYYASPEVWQDKPYDFKSDIWSLGCVLYESICLKPPFRADDMEGLYKKVLRGAYPKIPKYFSGDLSLIIKAMLKVSPSKRPSCNQILNTSIISSRLDTLFPNEVNDNEDVLLQTIYIPKKLSFLTERLPKPTYEDNGETDDESSGSKDRKIDDNGQSSLPNIDQTPPKPGIIKIKSIKENVSMSSSYSDYSYNKQKEKGLAENSYSIDTNPHEKGLPSPLDDYSNIYSSKADYFQGKLNNRLSAKREKGKVNNSSDSKLKIQRVKHRMNPGRNLNLKIEKNDYHHSSLSRKDSEEQSRDSSLVVIGTMDKKNISKSRPKQRPLKLLEDSERFSSVLKILAASDEINGNTDRNSKRSSVPPRLKKYNIPGSSKISSSLISQKNRIGGSKKMNNINVHKYSGKGFKKQKPRVGVAYISKPRFDKIQSVGRSNSQLNKENKSVSIVSLSPNNDLNYGKDMVLYNPYNKSISKQKIHLPYLKSRRAAPKIRKDPKQVRPRNESSIKNTSIDVLTSSHKNSNNKSLKNDKSFDLLREIKNLKKRISKPKVEDFDQSYRVGKR